MSRTLSSLDIPNTVEADEGGQEYVRFWIANKTDHVSLYIGGFDPAETEPRQWGHIMADIAKHAVRGMQLDDPTRGSPEQMLAEIEHGFFERLQHEGLVSGHLHGSKQ